MFLPEHNQLDIGKLSSVFRDTTNSYKFYWFLSILDSLRDNGESIISQKDITLRMLANVWYPLDYFKLSFGKRDATLNKQLNNTGSLIVNLPLINDKY